MNTEAIVYLLRKTNLTRQEIGKLSPRQFKVIFEEVDYQEAVAEWRRMHTVATILATIDNTKLRKEGSRTVYGRLKASDFLPGGMPQRASQKQDSLKKLAADRGIRLPSREIKER